MEAYAARRQICLTEIPPAAVTDLDQDGRPDLVVLEPMT